MMRLSFLATIVVVWSPFGLIHIGQRMANPAAQPIIMAATVGPSCSPTHWEACR